MLEWINTLPDADILSNYLLLWKKFSKNMNWKVLFPVDRERVLLDPNAFTVKRDRFTGLRLDAQ